MDIQETLHLHELWLSDKSDGVCADLSWADLSRANLRRANLRRANLSRANLGGATGLDDPAARLAQFECDDRGIIVYKRLGEGKTQYAPPAHWEERIGAILTETVNPDRGTECGSGVNFGTLEWCQKNYTEAHLWKCRIAWLDLAGIVVPFGTDGKARCGRLELLELVS